MPNTTNDQDQNDGNADLIKGLPMFTSRDTEALEREKAELGELRSGPRLKRWRRYLSHSGPGWMQSAVTLGSGSAMASLFAGAYLQYKLLWVQPLAMLLGVIMLSALSRQALCTQARPFDAMKKHINPALAWAWAISTLAATIIWHFPQYALAAGMTEEMIDTATGWRPDPSQRTFLLVGIGIVILAISTLITWSYASGRKGIKTYEKALKYLVWMVILAFGAVVLRQTIAGKIEWGAVGKGMLPLEIPTDPRGVSIVMGAFGAAVGINMTFLFPYTLLARGWGREHRGLARFDLLTGMLIPYCVATGLMIIATGSTIYSPEAYASGSTMLAPVKAAQMFESAGMGVIMSRFVFGFGILAMALSTITLHMLICGFAFCEIFKIEPGGWKYRLACLIPAPALLGVVLWKQMGPWIAVPTSAICGLMLPIAYIAFFLLNNNKKYMGADKPKGLKALVWNSAMIMAILVSLASVGYYLQSKFL